MSISISVNPAHVKRIEQNLANVVSNVKKEKNIAAWKAARKGESAIAKEVTSELATKQKTVKQHIRKKRLSFGASVALKKSARIPLKDFGARQKKVGVSYRISKSEGRKTIPGAFQGPRPGVMKASWKGNVFKRVGKARLPIVKLYGPSPWGVLRVSNRTSNVREIIQAEFIKQLADRLRYQRLKKSGAI